MKARSGPDGIHYFDRKSGVNILLDNVQVPPHDWSVAPRQISIALTNVCDLSCAYCYAPKNRNHLNFERMQMWLHSLDQLGCFGVGFGGGEPMLYPQFVEICRFGSTQTNLAITCTTHGHHLTPAIAIALKGHLHFMRLSMDGIGITYERLRNRSFEVFLQILQLALQVCPVGLNYVVNADTIADLPKAAILAEQYGVKELLLLPEQRVGDRTGIDLDTLELLRCWASEYSGKLTLAVNASAAEGFSICQTLPKETPSMAYAHINANGELQATSYSDSRVPIIGNQIRDALEVLKSGGLKE